MLKRTQEVRRYRPKSSQLFVVFAGAESGFTSDDTEHNDTGLGSDLECAESKAVAGQPHGSEASKNKILASKIYRFALKIL